MCIANGSVTVLLTGGWLLESEDSALPLQFSFFTRKTGLVGTSLDYTAGHVTWCKTLRPVSLMW